MEASTKFIGMYGLNERLSDDNDDIAYQCIVDNTALGLFSILFELRRPFLPRIHGYAENVLPMFISEYYKTHFRVSKEMFEEILTNIATGLILHHRGGVVQVEPSKQLLIFLCYMANRETLREIGQYFGVGITTVHTIIKLVLDTFNSKLEKIIQWPDFARQNEIAREIQLRYGLSDMMDILDGTHIRLPSCPGGDKDYVNRKYFPSMQLQVVVDDKLLITDPYTGWPVCTHDARVLRRSSLHTNAENGDYIAPNKFVAADSAYPLRNWLITPFKDNGHMSAEQRRLNRVFSSERQLVECAICHLKGRFRRLMEITVHSPEQIASTITAGCTLHNLCILILIC